MKSGGSAKSVWDGSTYAKTINVQTVKTKKMSHHHQNIKHKEDLLKQKQAECNKLYSQICNMRRHSKLKVSDHATVRCLERTYSMDIKKVHEELVTKQVEQMYSMLGDGTYPTGKGSTRVVIKDGVIVTVLN